MDYKRPLQASLFDQLSRSVTVIHVIINPRQVGKTTIARQIQDAIGIPSIYATADSPMPLDAAWKQRDVVSLLIHFGLNSPQIALSVAISSPPLRPSPEPLC